MAQNTLWRVNYSGKLIGTVAAADERSAIAQAAKKFHITPARRNRIVVTQLDEHRASRS
jgi:hypothetical protein